MNCPNCGVYNPEERRVCWRCDQELPKPREPKKKRQSQGLAGSRLWLLVGIALLLWIAVTFLLPLLFGGLATP